MRKALNKYSTRHDQRFDYHLEPTDFDYLKDEFVAHEDLLGITLTSVKNPNLSIHIGTFDIKYDNDISARRMMIATERVTIPMRLLLNNNGSDEYKSFIPNTADKLINLISEFKYRGMGNVKNEEIIEFLLAESK